MKTLSQVASPIFDSSSPFRGAAALELLSVGVKYGAEPGGYHHHGTLVPSSLQFPDEAIPDHNGRSQERRPRGQQHIRRKKEREPFWSQTKEPSEDHGADACQVIWVGLVCTSRRAANPLSFCGALKVVRTRWPPLFQPRPRAVPKKRNQRRLNWIYKRNLTIVQGSSRVYICLVNYMGRVFIWMPAPHSTLSQHPLPLLIWRRVHHGVAIVCRPRDCKPLECWMRAFCVHLRDLFV